MEIIPENQFQKLMKPCLLLPSNLLTDVSIYNCMKAEIEI